MVQKVLKRALGTIFVAAGGLLSAALPSTGASADTNQLVIVTSYGTSNPVSAVLQAGGTVLTQYTIINGVEASVPSLSLPTLAALPGVVVTPDANVSVQSTTVSTGPHTPSDSFLAQTGATNLASGGATGQGVRVAVLDTGLPHLPDFAGRHRRGHLGRQRRPVQRHDPLAG